MSLRNAPDSSVDVSSNRQDGGGGSKDPLFAHTGSNPVASESGALRKHETVKHPVGCQCATCSPSGVEWATPQDLFDAIDKIHGPFMLDACATDENAKCRDDGKGWYTKRDDALNCPWVSAEYPTVWMNPPYGRGIGAWVKKARAEAMKGGIVACLLPAKMDTAWWHYIWSDQPAENHVQFNPAAKLGRYTAAHFFLDGYGTDLNIDIYFLKGRLNFGESAGPGRFASAVVIFDGRK